MLYWLLSVMALAPLVCLQPPGAGETDSVQTVCTGSRCYTLQQDNRKFNMARRLCSAGGGNAMTVTSTQAAEAVSLLLQNPDVPGSRFWIGLELRLHKCPDNQTELRGYRWVDGETHTDYTNWKSVSAHCGTRCVTVSRDLTWEDRPCNVKADGILCEFVYYEGMCTGLAMAGGSLTYTTPFGGHSSGLSYAPPGTVASLSPSGLKLECLPEGMDVWDWNSQSSGPWECQDDNDGYSKCSCRPESELKVVSQDCFLLEYCQGRSCHSICVDNTGSVSCTCPGGYDLDRDSRSCIEIDECLRRPCEGDLICSNTPGSFSCHCPTGYSLTDGHKCREINECSRNPSPCHHKCGNTPGSFTCSCYFGFQLSPNDFTRCVFYCNTSECKPHEDREGFHCPVGYILQGGVCVDIDECTVAATCHHSCTNTYGSFECSCPLGYQLKEDKRTCENASRDVPEVTQGGATPASPTDHPAVAGAGLTPGALLGVIASVAVAILVLACLGHHLLKRRGERRASAKHKPRPGGEQDVKLSQVLAGGGGDGAPQSPSQSADEKAGLTC